MCSASLPGVAHGGQQSEVNQTLPNGKINGPDASRIRWRRIANVNATIEIRSLVSRAPNILHLQWHSVGRPSVAIHR